MLKSKVTTTSREMTLKEIKECLEAQGRVESQCEGDDLTGSLDPEIDDNDRVLLGGKAPPGLGTPTVAEVKK